MKTSENLPMNVLPSVVIHKNSNRDVRRPSVAIKLLYFAAFLCQKPQISPQKVILGEKKRVLIL